MKAGLLDTIKASVNWGGMFPDKKKEEEAENYYNTVQKQYDPSIGLLTKVDASDAKPLKEPPKQNLFQAIASSVGDFLNPKMTSPIPMEEVNKPTKPEPITALPSPAPTVQASPSKMKPIPPGLPEGVTSKNNLVPSTPPQEVSDAIQKAFGDEAGKALVVAFSENGGYRPTAVNKNSHGSVDTGIFPINSNTFNEFMRRKKDQLEKLGIVSYEDMNDPYKNALMAKLVRDEQGWGAWYGQKNRGFIIN